MRSPLPTRPRPTLALALLTLATLAGCGGDGESQAGAVLSPAPPVSLAGEWSTIATESLDTCGFDPPAPFAALLVEDHGDTVVFTFADPLGFCDRSVRQRSGDVVRLTRTDTIDGGCGIVQVRADVVYEFTPSGTLRGSAHYHYSMVSGACSNVPCDYALDISGGRCDDCWSGCVDVAAARTAPGPAGDASPETFAVAVGL